MVQAYSPDLRSREIKPRRTGCRRGRRPNGSASAFRWRSWDLGRVNAANNRVRFAKFSVERGNLLLEADFVYYLGATDAVEGMRQILDLWRMALHEL